MEKGKTLDLCEKLARCPKGTKLWSPLRGDCKLVEVSDVYPEIVVLDQMGRTTFDKYGHYFSCSEECLLFPSRENRDWDNWECPKPKVERFDPKTLQPFDEVLGRDASGENWRADIFSHFFDGGKFPVCTIYSEWRWGIPYNENTKHLLGTSNEAPEYYRWWEDK